MESAGQGGESTVRVRAPELSGQPEDWLNTNGKALHLRGKDGLLNQRRVVLVDFWEYTCVNCIRTFPYLKEWHKRYAKDGLVIIGIHTPEFEFAKDSKNVAEAVSRFGLEFPILLDSDYANWQAFANHYWPMKYLIDARGYIVYQHAGEGNYGQTEAQIRKLLKQINPKVQLPPLMEPVRGADKPGAICYPVTPEIYAGYQRGHLGSPEGYRPGEAVMYNDSGRYEDSALYARGFWRNLPESLRHARKTARLEDYIAIRYRALEVNAVIRPEGGEPFRVYIRQDDRPVPEKDKGADIRYENGQSYIWVTRSRMYNLIRNARYGSHTLKLSSVSDGFGLYSFTFTSCEEGGKD
ncbi:MAG: redoxin family protein [Armatimonadetes bacterium]|nr:redoxin family protein [Armatimonadota bacterium]